MPTSGHCCRCTLGADALVKGAYREPQRAVLFYATDDDAAATTIERLIRAARLRPTEGGRRRRRRTNRGARRRPPPVRLERQARRSRPSARCGRGRGTRVTALPDYAPAPHCQKDTRQISLISGPGARAGAPIRPLPAGTPTVSTPPTCSPAIGHQPACAPWTRTCISGWSAW